MLEDAGIEVRITDGRSYKGGFGRTTGYRKHEQERTKPAVWVVRAEDQPRARQMLREAGLLETSNEAGSFLSGAPQPAQRTVVASPSRTAARIRFTLFAIVLVLAGWSVLRMLGIV